MLIQLLIMVLVLGIIFMILQNIPVAPPFRNIAYAIVLVIFLVILLRMLGLLSPDLWRIP